MHSFAEYSGSDPESSGQGQHDPQQPGAEGVPQGDSFSSENMREGDSFADHHRQSKVHFKNKRPGEDQYYHAARFLSYESFPMQLAIDGGAGTGKSKIAERLANDFGAIYLDTGLLYRAIAILAYNESIAIEDLKTLSSAEKAKCSILHCLKESGIFLDDKELEDAEQLLAEKYEILLRYAKTINLDFSNCDVDPAVLSQITADREIKPHGALIPGINYTPGLSRLNFSLTDVLYSTTSEETLKLIDVMASEVAQLGSIREILLSLQQDIGLSGILAGRDVGTKVFPSANLKIILSADVQERARRRTLQRGGKDLESVAKNIESRDRNDSGNLLSVPVALSQGYYLIDSPAALSQPEFEAALDDGRFVIDSTHMGEDETYQIAHFVTQKKLEALKAA